MKKTFIIIIILFITVAFTKAQDTMYYYKSGQIVYSRITSEIDSVIFNQQNSNINNCGTVTDVDGNTYNTVVIGAQCWLKENLNTSRYADGTAIPNVTDNITFGTLTTGAYRDYNNTPSNSITYGKLYNWYAAANLHNICPTGWHLPSNGEWNIMEKYLDNTVDTTFVGQVGVDIGSKLKESGTSHWTSQNNGTNSSGFSALPGGYSAYTFYDIGDYCGFWTSTNYDEISARDRSLRSSWATVFNGASFKYGGLSIRCVKD